MGRSKFPGKPSKLVTKKRVSVLNGNNLSSSDSSQNEAITSNTLNAFGCPINDSNNDIDADTDTQNIAVGARSNNDIEPESDIALRSTAAKCEIVQASKSKESQFNDGNENGAPEESSSKKQTKKKKVSFKFGLETSDDAHIVKKEPNATFDPPVPIIKKECLIRANRGGESIIMPSRLTGLTQKFRNNNANNIDKLNSLTFKSQFAKTKETNEENATSNDDDQSDAEGDNETHQKDSDDCKSDSEGEHSLNKNDEGRVNEEDNTKCVSFQFSTRHAHPSRVVKPNKRSTEDSKSTICKNGLGKKKSSKLENDPDTSDSNKKEDEDNVLKISDHIKNNPFAKISDDSIFGFSSKSILRQSRLQFTSVLTPTSTLSNASSATTSKESLFASSLSNNTINRNAIPQTIKYAEGSNKVCGICATPATLTHQSPKYGISSCDPCRKFISKTIKKLPSSDDKSTANTLQCKKGDGNCVLCIRISKVSKKRCQACLLKKCLQTYRLSPDIRAKLYAILPLNMQNNETKPFISTFPIKTETNTGDLSSPQSNGINNLFGGSLSSCRRLVPAWSATKDSTENTEFRSFTSLSNPLAENNSKFGSSPQIVPNILEKPSIMTTSLSSSLSPNSSTSSTKITETKETKSSTSQNEATSKKSVPLTNGNNNSTEQEETSRLRLRKKDRTETVTTPVSITLPTLTTSVTTTAGIELGKRQRIDLKGPRVKHVCRSASIVLGQPIATFGDENQILDTLDTPPRPESPNGIVDFHEPPASIIATQNDKQNDSSECADSTRLSPPATPIINDYDSESTTKEQFGEKSPSENSKSDDATSVTSVESLKRNEEIKPITRKISRPYNITSNNIPPINNKKLNSFIRKPVQKPKQNMPPTISIDFWENYDPAEVSQTGFGLIFSEQVEIKALCYLCGSCGQEPLIFCVCCCEPYHQYCVEDEYNLKQHVPIDDTNASLMDTSLISTIGSNALSSPANRLNWLCPRCTICHSCNMASGSKVKCQKCHKNYHSTCLGTSKRLLGADRPLICTNCLKCKCGKTTVSKFVGNLPMCSKCFRDRKNQSLCPLCKKCYDENDFNIKMMECGVCHLWVHSKCENLTDEQYNMLSALPENIEFICRNCAPNPTASTWRDAVLAEFKKGLLDVVKLLSRSRQACALLKLSPRKKPSMCSICIQNKQQNEFNDMDFEEKLEDPFDFSASQTNEINSLSSKCYCSTQQSQKANTSQSLIDIKQRILANKYYSLADFNYDMNVVINAAACDDLMTAYKEILSEAFPWFQNETKACTDALVEDMYDSCSFDQSSMENEEIDQQVPMIDVPDDIDEYFYQPVPSNDARICMFCKGCGDGASTNESRLLYCGQNSWVHANCAMWSAEVFEEIDGSLQNVHGAISRGRMIKCSGCGNKGATVGCNIRNCGEHYHFPCARKFDCAFMTDKTVFCPQHSKTITNDGQINRETNFEVLRPVYVELDRKRKRPVCPKKVQFLIGSLHVKQLGRFVHTLSDRTDAIVPADFLCSRLYWSSKEPWKIVEYTIRTSVQSNFNIATDSGRNFTIDHSNNLNKVQIGLAKIAKWHSSLLCGEDNENPIRFDRSFKVVNGMNEETNEEEPQTNADVLPPEIQDAIFEDIPHDILDGFSMLDIFPEVMSTSADTKNEALLNTDLLRDNTTDDDTSQGSQKGFDIESWTSMNMHAEDAMLSSRSAAGHFKRNKSELFARSTLGNRGQRSWNNKLDTAISAKRRKRIELRLPENLFFSLQSDEIKNKSFTWTAAKQYKFLQMNNDSPPQQKSNTSSKNRFKISQLDGMDDITLDIKSQNTTIKCDRCHCTYRTHDSFQRHLMTCEQFSSRNEGDSNANSKTPEIQQQQNIQSNMILTSVNGQDYCNIPIIQQNNQSQQIFGISGTNINQLAMQNSVQIHNGQSLPIASIQNGGLPVQMQGMFINPNTGALQSQQSQIFGQPLTIGALQQQVFPIQNISQNVTSQNIQYQPQILTCSTANTSQVLSVTPSQQQNITTSNFASIKTIQTQPQVNRNAIILPQVDKNSPTKKQAITKLQMSPNRSKGRIATATSAQKTIQIKKANVLKTENSKAVTQITNTSVTNIRPTSTSQIENNNIMIQSSTNPSQAQPIIVQQMAQANQGNLLQYVTASDSNNGLQYFTMPTNDVKPMQTTQYLTPNPLIPGTFQLQSDNSNLLLANTASGLQMLPNGTLQLAQHQQPQVIGTLIQPQATTIQCGMMSSEQMMLGSTPSFEMVTNQIPGCMLLNSQPVYYGLETIVQNTVMQSQQFVSTAMQGVLSQNSSFSATTTQVFQASKIEPIMDMQQSYVVLNNDGTIMTPQAQQPILTTANLLQQAMPQISNQSTTQIQPTANSGWRIVDDKSTVFSTANQNPGILQAQASNQPIHATQMNTMNVQQTAATAQPITSQPVVQLQKVQPQKQIAKQRQAKQTFGVKNLAKPVVKSSPIVVNEIQIPQNDVKQFINLNSKPLEPMTKVEIDNPNTPLNTMPSATDAKISSKVSAPNITQRRLNTTKPIVGNKVNAAAAVKPKIIGKTLKQTNAQISQKSLRATSTSNALISGATKPLQTITMATTKPSTSNKIDFSLQKPIEIPKPSMPILNNDVPSSEISSSSEAIAPKTIDPICIPNTSTSSSLSVQQSPAVSSTGLQIVQQPSNGLPSTQLNPSSIPANDAAAKTLSSQFTSILNTQNHITLPISSSIQLPTAPYANGIPTNVVNPIKQYTNTRPTNRVLPMQTILPKCSPTESIETKPIDIKSNLLKMNDTHTEQIESKAEDFMPTSSRNSTPEIKDDSLRMDDDMEVDSTGTGALEIDEDQVSDFKIDKMDDEDSDSSDMDAFKDTFLRGSSAEEVFDKLKKEEQQQQTEKNISKVIEKFESERKTSIEEAEDDIFGLPDVPSDITTVVSSNSIGSLPELDPEPEFKPQTRSETTSIEEAEEQKENLTSTGVGIFRNVPPTKMQKTPKDTNASKITGPRLLYEIQSQDGFTYKSTSITEIWEKLFEAVQIARKAHGLSSLPVGPLADMCGYQMMGLKTNALKYLLEQLPGVERCSNYIPTYHKRAESTVSQTTSSGYWSDCEEIKENPSGTARCEKYKGRSEYDMFSWLASRHRKQPIQICVPQNGIETETLVRRGSGSNLPMAMRYRTLKDSYKDSVGVYRSHIHGRGLFCNRDIEAGEMVIEYAGELIRSTLTDKRERYYDSRGIGCYMFKIDDNLVVDATMRGNAARFINHSCEPNCYSKVVDILGHKHIIIFALRRIVQGEELTYDYKFPFEETKIPCSCGSRKCRKYLN